MRMSALQELLAHIGDIRSRFKRTQGLLLEADVEAKQLSDRQTSNSNLLAGGERVQSLLDASVLQLKEIAARTSLPELTHRARMTAERCRGLVRELRTLGQHAVMQSAPIESPLTTAHRQCAALSETAVRLIQGFPADAATQTRLCSGLDGVLDVLADKLGVLYAACNRQAVRDTQVRTLSHWLDELQAGRRLALAPVTALAEAIAHNAFQGEPLKINVASRISPAADLVTATTWRTRHVATHGINVAHVVARVFPQSIELQIAALVADVGLLNVPAPVLAQPTQLAAPQWQLIERHPHLGSSWLSELTNANDRIVQTVRDHHERPDGTGYPSARKVANGLAAQLSACSTYAALLAPRPHREALDPCKALTEVLLAAERGDLIKDAAQAVSRLSFFPVGSVVELDDGALGLVVSTSQSEPAAHPMIAVLTDAEGHRVSGPQLAQQQSVVKALSADDRRRRLGAQYPQYA